MITATRLAALIADWDHEAAVARASLRKDDYAAQCADTAEALRELEQLRRQHREIICTQCALRAQLGQIQDAGL